MSEQGTPTEGSTYTPPQTQAELDRIITERLSRERGKYADYDDLKAKAAKFDEAESSSKSEMQKLQDAIAERDAQIADLPKQARQQAIRFASEASKAGFLDPEDALAFIDADLADAEAVKVALAELAERKPHLVRAPDKHKPPTRPKPAGGEAPPEGDGLQGKERAAAALRQLRK